MTSRGMLPRSNRYRSRAGQSTTETIVLLPVYLLLALGLLQLGQLSTALLVANYAASAIARQAVQDGTAGGGAGYTARFQNVMTAGMKNPVVNVAADGGGLLSNVVVYACADLSAFPFVGELLLRPALGNRYAGDGNCGAGGKSLGPVYFNGTPPYRFTVRGKAIARMNYKP